MAASGACDAALADLDQPVGDRRLIVRVDRIELSKNLLRGFYAFDDLLERRAGAAGRGGLRRLRLPLPPEPGRIPGLPPGGRGPGRAGSTAGGRTADWTPILLDTSDDSPGRWPPSAATTCCWSTRSATA